MQISHQIYNCENCDYHTSKKTDYEKHILTRKHNLATNIEQKSRTKNTEKKFACENCGKSYIARNSYWYHKKKCDIKLHENTSDKSNIKLEDLISENIELKEIMIEQNKQIFELVNKVGNNTTNNTTNNTINNKFNLTVFLNEDCKDAVNIEDFIDSLQIQLKDLENTKEQGLVQSISDILIKGLNNLDVNKRPIHCTDTKRDVLYIKDEEKWKKDQQKDKIKQSINEIAQKQRIAINQWTDAHPGWMDSDGLKDAYVKLVNHLMLPVEETEKDQNKIIKNVSAATVIDR